ncbi:MAG TPA: hypothetical protein VII06_16555 [Chloroflexota bacterium]
MQEQRTQDSRRRMKLGGGAVVIGLILVLLSLLPFMHAEQNGPLVLGDYEVFVVIGLVFLNLGLLVLLQEWFGLV